MIITGISKFKSSARFHGCKNLKVAEGTFPGFVDFNNSGIERIGNLRINQTNDDGEKASFFDCPNLNQVPAQFLEPEYLLSNTQKSRIIKTRQAKQLIKNQPEIEI